MNIAVANLVGGVGVSTIGQFYRGHTFSIRVDLFPVDGDGHPGQPPPSAFTVKVTV